MRRYPNAENGNVDTRDKNGNTPFDPDCEAPIFYHNCDSFDDNLHKKLNLS